MQTHQINDTSTQAMTEVALGLSMAFFALLILALMSFQLPSVAKDKLAQSQDINILAADAIKLEQNTPPVSSNQSKLQYLLFFRNNFYDLQLQVVSIADLSEQQELIVAVGSTMSFVEVMAVRQKINRPNISITLITQEWQSLLEKKL